MLNGFLNVCKPEGITSHDVVAILRKITGVKQIGHTGTLDPFAQGVVPVCIGKTARLIEYLDDDKEYSAVIRFGKTTSTYDKEGEITKVFDTRVNAEQIQTALKNFQGEIMQTPPIYSAIKVKGKKLYDYARNGEEVKIEPRKIFIKKILLTDFNYAEQFAKVDIECSKGTYIRAIANDLGLMLNCGGYLSELTRIHAGKFNIENSVKLDTLNSFEAVEKYLINPLEILDLPKLEITCEEHDKIIHGMAICNKSNINNGFVILVYNNKISAVGMANFNEVKMKKVFE